MGLHAAHGDQDLRCDFHGIVETRHEAQHGGGVVDEAERVPIGGRDGAATPGGARCCGDRATHIVSFEAIRSHHRHAELGEEHWDVGKLCDESGVLVGPGALVRRVAVSALGCSWVVEANDEVVGVHLVDDAGEQSAEPIDGPHWGPVTPGELLTSIAGCVGVVGTMGEGVAVHDEHGGTVKAGGTRSSACRVCGHGHDITVLGRHAPAIARAAAPTSPASRAERAPHDVGGGGVGDPHETVVTSTAPLQLLDARGGPTFRLGGEGGRVV